MTDSKILPMGEIHQVVAALLMKYGAEKAILFGSYARGAANSQSDIDLVVIGREHFDPTNVFTIAEELYHFLGKAVDVYDISEINSGTEFYNTIFSEGIEIKAE